MKKYVIHENDRLLSVIQGELADVKLNTPAGATYLEVDEYFNRFDFKIRNGKVAPRTSVDKANSAYCHH